MTELVSPFQERRAIRSSAIPAGFASNSLEMPIQIFFIVVRLCRSLFQC
jgi:hypothetical protein